MSDSVARSASRAVCVLGMGRSGTSLTASVLRRLGVDFGPKGEMLPADATDNAEGYWELAAIMDLNERILHAFGGRGWARPPEFPDGWEYAEWVQPLLDEARSLISRYFDAVPLWGWKDPRTPLTLPFWRRVVSEPEYVLCVRHPVAVAASLARRGTEPLTWDESIALWLRYTARAVAETQGRRRLIVCYDDYIEDPTMQVARLARFLRPDVDPRPGAIESVGATVRRDLRHNTTSSSDLLDESVPPEGVATYAAMRLAASEASGPVISAPALEAVPGLLRAYTARVGAAALGSRVSLAEADAAEAWRRHNIVVQSRSWRLTAPFRKMAAVHRRTRP